MTSNEVSEATAGLAFPDGAFIELLQGQRLLLWKHGKARTAPSLKYKGKLYVPENRFSQAMWLPQCVTSPPSPTELLSALEQEITPYVSTKEDARLFSYFVLSTWFADCLDWVPSLLLHGPLAESLQLMRLLVCLCRRGLLLSALRGTTLESFPSGLCPTLLIAESRLSASRQQSLAASNQRSFVAIAPSGIVSSNVAKVIFCEEAVTDPWLLRSSLPMSVPRSNLHISIDQSDIVNRLQSSLLGYRLKNFKRVRESHFDPPGFVTETRQIARALGACIVGAIDCEAELIDILHPFDQHVRGEFAVEFNPILAEALMVEIHDDPKPWVMVGLIARTMNAILSGRRQTIELSDRRVGELLKRAGFLTGRVPGGAGRSLKMDDTIRWRIHQFANQYQIHLDKEKVEGCRFCAEFAQ